MWSARLTAHKTGRQGRAQQALGPCAQEALRRRLGHVPKPSADERVTATLWSTSQPDFRITAGSAHHRKPIDALSVGDGHANNVRG
ncbi:MAG: hypothetical protein H6837_15875 [Planctomycetes bacterium]|nr:hypothetical protein [Planctomycetota bacterium]